MCNQVITKRLLKDDDQPRRSADARLDAVPVYSVPQEELEKHLLLHFHEPYNFGDEPAVDEEALIARRKVHADERRGHVDGVLLDETRARRVRLIILDDAYMACSLITSSYIVGKSRL